MVENPLVSVIIPTFNRGWALTEAVDSVLEQDYRHFELIVVDDGSTDDTSRLLRDYGNAITVIPQHNQGVSAARNKGFSRAEGELIAFLDSDDHWLQGKLRRQVEFFQKHPDALVCQTEEMWVRNGKRVNPKKRHKKPSGMIFEHSLELCLVSPSAVMMRKKLFDDVGVFDETLPACEDYDLWLRVACRHPVYLIDIPLIVKKGGHSDQLSQTPGLDKYRIKSLVKLLKYEPLDRRRHGAATAVLKKKCIVYAGGCRKRGRVKEAKYYESLSASYTFRK